MTPAAEAFRLGHAADAGWEGLAGSCVAQMGDLPEGANLGVVYATDLLDEDLPRIVDRLRERTGVAHWSGTVGLGVMAGGREYFDRPALAVMAGRLPEDGFRVLPTVRRPGDPLPAEVADWARREGVALGILHGDPGNPYVADILNSVADDTDALLVGGLTSSRGRQIQIADGPTDGGVSGLLFSGAVPAVSGLTQGCTPLGPAHEVTRAEGNVLAELGGRPALEVLGDSVGAAGAGQLRNIHVALPVAGGGDGDYLVRNILGVVGGGRGLAVGDRVAAGDRVMFVRRDRAAAVRDLHRMLDGLGGGPGGPGGPRRAAFYHSCLARGPNLFEGESEEPATVQAALGAGVPVAGFFANGEISRGRCYGYTGVLTVLG